MPDNLQTIDDLRRKLDNCREIKGQLRERCEAAEADVGPMRATIGRLKSEIADKDDAIERAEIEGLKQRLNERDEADKRLRQSQRDYLAKLWQKYNLPASEKPHFWPPMPLFIGSSLRTMSPTKGPRRKLQRRDPGGVRSGTRSDDLTPRQVRWPPCLLDDGFRALC